ncbi:TPA: hypothetical protein JAJ32_000042 [Legionella pneumophila]|uniref:Uncharacterized protein n=1 Tax=Legionella pneumophila TaxID=446 RepID=A0AAN5KTU4_LEGPN|nr:MULTISPECIES: hypothetical protein [Legionella]APF03545.1 hypothetical protein BIZ52_09315 [Legionella pneumophila subsp. fraseri]MCK1870213.1 hypothetical protein [Legionella pneumophila]MDI2078955.1 hypothetical protein [Legionella pneumophila]NSL17319.1 hypothetical protein [Legionella micdadei]CCD09314.1 exported protein of unknown function [Legionella pneumophila subsp. pneumophila]
MSFLPTTIYSVILFFFSEIIFADENAWLQDTDCKIMSSNGLQINIGSGSLISSICDRDGSAITCSHTTNDSSKFNGKPSTITNYTELKLNNEFSIWVATSHEGMIVLDIKNKRYSVTSTHLLPEGLLNKNCIGKIKEFFDK